MTAREAVDLECRRLGLSPERVRGPGRAGPLVRDRKRVARALEGFYTEQEIAEALGRVNHTSARYWLGKGAQPKRAEARKRLIAEAGLGL